MSPEFRELVTGIDLAIRSDTLTVAAITSHVGVEATRAFDKGETYRGIERVGDGEFREVERARPWGVWHFCSSAFIKVNSVEEHALFLLGKLEHARDAIQSLIAGERCGVVIRIWYVGPDGFYISGPTAMRLASLCEEISVTCWETEETEDANAK